MSSDNNIHVVTGAGVTGLTAAVELERQGKTVVVLEASKHHGGMARSFSMDGVVFDLGPHMLMLNPNRKCGVYLKELLRDEKLYRRRYLFAINDGHRNWQSPVTPLELLRYPAWARNDVLTSLLRRIAKKQTAPTLSNYISRRSGKNIYSAVFEPLVHKKLGTNGSMLHENWWLRPPKNVSIQDRISSPVAGEGTAKAILGKYIHELLPMYRYPKRGIGTVTDLLRNQFTGRLITSCGDIKTSSCDGNISEVTFPGTTLKTASLVWTAPVNDFYKAVSGASQVATETISTRMVFITFRTSHLPRRPYLYSYYIGTDTVFNRVYYPRSIYREDSPSGLEGFCFEIRLTDDIRKKTRRDLINLTASDALKAGIASGVVISADVVDLYNSSPLFSVDYLEKELFGAASSFNNLVFAGRHGNYCNCLIPEAVEQGLQAAKWIDHASL